MLVYAAFMPHTPLLLESVGKANRKKLKRTVPAVAKLAKALAAARPDTIVIFSSHTTQHAEAFSINLHEPYRADLSKFGDLGTERAFAPDLQLVDTIQRALRRQGLPVTLDTDHSLDHGSAVPLLSLTGPTQHIRVVPITYTSLSPKDHAAFGRALKEMIVASPKRIAVVASGDLSHALDKKSPVPARPEGKLFDDAMVEAVSNASLSQLLALDPDLVLHASECAYRPLLMLLGLLAETTVYPQLLAYEAPFGVGYLTAQFTLEKK